MAVAKKTAAAPAKKAPARRSPAKKSVMKKVIIKTEEVPVGQLQMFHNNPNVGDVEEIAISLNESGMFKPITVNVGTHTGRVNEILAGNHTWLAARQEVWYDAVDPATGEIEQRHKPVWDTITVSWVDVDEAAAARIVVGDNAIAARARQDARKTAELLRVANVKVGVGLKPEEYDAIMANLNETASTAGPTGLDEIMSRMDLTDITGMAPKKSMRQKQLDEEDDDDREAATMRGASRPDDEPEADEPPLTDKQTELQAVLELREDKFYPSSNFWQVPDLLMDMIPKRFPRGLKTWGGNDATPDDGKSWYLYNYSLGGVKGLPFDRSIVSFFTHDRKFENWWQLPAYYTSKLLAAGCQMAICPDFSFYTDMTRSVHLHGVYKSQWLGRFMQDAGMKVIPRFQFADEDSMSFNMLGIPHNTPVLAVSLQNVDAITGTKYSDEWMNLMVKCSQRCIDEIEPTTEVLFYGGNPAKRVMERVDLHGAKGIHLMNYVGVRRGVVYDKKDGTAQLTAAQKKKIKQGIQDKLGGRPKSSRDIDDDDEE